MIYFSDYGFHHDTIIRPCINTWETLLAQTPYIVSKTSFIAYTNASYCIYKRPILYPKRLILYVQTPHIVCINALYCIQNAPYCMYKRPILYIQTPHIVYTNAPYCIKNGANFPTFYLNPIFLNAKFIKIVLKMGINMWLIA